MIAEILGDVGEATSWSALPAKLVLETDEDAGEPESASALVKAFPSLGRVADWYVDQISSVSWGKGAFWHEPLWVVSQDGRPHVVLDEAGGVHLTVGSLVESLAVLALVTDLGGIDDPHSFEILDALTRADCSLSALARHLRNGPAATLRAVKPDLTTTDPGSATSSA